MHRTTAAVAVAVIATLAPAASARAEEAVPGGSPGLGYRNLTDGGWLAFEAYLAAASPKAFAVSADGAWGWTQGPTLAAAMDGAMQRCAEYADHRCQVVGGNREILVGLDDADSPTIMTLPMAVAAPGFAALRGFLVADGNRAVALGRGGAWGWSASSAASIGAVQATALTRCARSAPDCRLTASVQAD